MSKPADLQTSFGELGRQQRERLCELRLVSRRFEALVTPIVFQNVKMDLDLARVFCIEGTPTYEDMALLHVAMLSSQYARVLTFEGHAMSSFEIAAIQRMESFQVLRYQFPDFEKMTFDYGTIDLLRYRLPYFEVHVDDGGTQLVLKYEAREGEAEVALRSIEVETKSKLYFHQYGFRSTEWSTVESITTNGYLDLHSSVSHSVKTLRLNRSISGQYTVGAATSHNVEKLNGWLPNLAELELNFQDGEALGSSAPAFTPAESRLFVEQLARMPKLRKLVLRSRPRLIERSSSPRPPTSSEVRSMENERMVDGPARLTAYKARATRTAFNILLTLIKRKVGVQFERLTFEIEQRSLQEEEHNMRKRDSKDPPWAGKCVPSMIFKWSGGYKKSNVPDMEVSSENPYECKLCERSTAHDQSCADASSETDPLSNDLSVKTPSGNSS